MEWSVGIYCTSQEGNAIVHTLQHTVLSIVMGLYVHACRIYNVVAWLMLSNHDPFLKNTIKTT